MKINFSKVSVKNFLSFGNNVTNFDYNPGIHAVTGRVLPGNLRNGVGKSTILAESIIFAIYNKTLRKLTKNEIINTSNKKDCVVSCEFTIGKFFYKIKRSIKPGTLEVWKSKTPITSDDDPIEFDSMSNTQKWIENEINISFNAFTNMIVMNVNHSKPFLEMTPQEKRPVLEDMLSLNVYGKMAEITKKKHLEANTEVKDLESALKNKIDTYNLSKEKRENILKEIDRFEEEKQEYISELNNKINDLNEKKSKLENKVKENVDYDQILNDLDDKLNLCNEKLKNLEIKQNENENKIKELTEALKVLKDKPYCPTCKTPTDNPIIKSYIDESDSQLEECKKKRDDLINKIDKGQDTKTKIKSKVSKVNTEKDQQKTLNHEIKNIISKIENIKENIANEEKRKLDLDEVISKEDIDELKKEVKSLKDHYDKENKNFKYFKYLRNILGEEGIRRYVIKKVLPLFNQKVNHYLSVLGSNYTIKFDSELNEKLFSKNLQERSYASFSGGEKKRIDLSVLLAMMDISKTQNSIDTNILILDEVLDTSMDSNGVEMFMEHLRYYFKNNFPDKCIYVITHRNEVSEEYFDSIINLIKKNDFTEVENISA